MIGVADAKIPDKFFKGLHRRQHAGHALNLNSPFFGSVRRKHRARNVPGAKGSGRAAHVQKNHVGLADMVLDPGGVDQGGGRTGRGREKDRQYEHENDFFHNGT